VDLGAAFDQPPRHPAAEPRATAGDQHALAGQYVAREHGAHSFAVRSSIAWQA
jgi:hypothetical protein